MTFLWQLDRAKLSEVDEESLRVGYDSADVRRVRQLLSLPEDKFVELQLKRAVDIADPARVINRTIRLRTLYLDKHASLFDVASCAEPQVAAAQPPRSAAQRRAAVAQLPRDRRAVAVQPVLATSCTRRAAAASPPRHCRKTARYGKLRAPVEFAAARSVASKLLGSKEKTAEAQAGMLYFSRAVIPTSLTQLDPAATKEATSLFKAALSYAGERPHPHPPAVALQILQAGAAKAELRPEIYFQIMKQLRNTPSADAARK